MKSHHFSSIDSKLGIEKTLKIGEGGGGRRCLGKVRERSEEACKKGRAFKEEQKSRKRSEKAWVFWSF